MGRNARRKGEKRAAASHRNGKEVVKVIGSDRKA